MILDRIARTVVLSLVVVALGGCAFVPASGPAANSVTKEGSPTVPYVLVRLTPESTSIVARYEPVEWEEGDELGESRRGAGGFGSSGRQNY